MGQSGGLCLCLLYRLKAVLPRFPEASLPRDESFFSNRPRDSALDLAAFHFYGSGQDFP